MEQILDQLPEDQPIIISRVHSSRKRDRNTQLWVVQVGPHKASNHQLLVALNQVKEQYARSS